MLRPGDVTLLVRSAWHRETQVSGTQVISGTGASRQVGQPPSRTETGGERETLVLEECLACLPWGEPTKQSL